jgi:hypothetical protein
MRYVTIRGLLHRITSVLAPGAGHLSVGHFNFGFPVLVLWALSMGGLLTVHYFAPSLVVGPPLGPKLQLAFGLIAALTYLVAQAVKPKAPVVAAAPRRPRAEQEA